MPSEITPVTRYTRQDVLRILRVAPRDLMAWERAGLTTSSEDYSFEDLVQVRKLRDLRATRISVRSIRASVDAMQRVAGMRNPLLEAGAVSRGSRLAFRHSGALVDAETQQFVFDFEMSARPQRGPMEVVRPGTQSAAMRVQEMFQRAVQMEEAPATKAEAIAIYEAILELAPAHAPACINLGTILYNQRHFERAESLYRRATIADCEYALAFFDLGNVLDELQRLPEAIEAYQRAIKLVPGYADAHYNLALAFERQGQKRRALRHWLAYVRLDPVGPWASHARAQAKKTLSGEKLAIVSRRGRLVESMAG